MPDEGLGFGFGGELANVDMGRTIDRFVRVIE